MGKLVLGAGLFVFLAHFLDALFEKTRIPDILFLILLGVVVGSGLEWIRPEDFGLAGSLLGTITLVVILFESGLSLPLRSLATAAGKSVPCAVWTVECSTLLPMRLWCMGSLRSSR
jgi:NhaP-type Na+/H+ or K+/H+ antiporter